MTTNLTPRQQVYAFWGAASNSILPLDERLDYALGALRGIQGLLETAEWEAQLLAGQRDHVLRWCKDREAEGTVRIWDLYSIFVTDGADNP